MLEFFIISPGPVQLFWAEGSDECDWEIYLQNTDPVHQGSISSALAIGRPNKDPLRGLV